MGRCNVLGLAVGMLVVGCGSRAATVPRSVVQVTPAAQQASAPEAAVEPPATVLVVAERPRIEVVFALDTTGSMGGLIEGAKQKIWAIADELASAEPSPELRVGLVAYRDRGDQYVTQHFPLTDDLDLVYQQLHALRADGGGDGPESVNQALHEAVHQSAWSDHPRTYRTIFLVGDAPPHMDYPDDVPYATTVEQAARRGIVLNSVQCGSDAAAKTVWLAIAQAGQGTYAAIAQSGGMQEIAAPMDEEIERLSARLSGTVMPYGQREAREKVRSKARLSSAAPAAASAARHAYLGKKGGEIVTGGGDLVDDVRSGRVALGALAREELPEELRDLAPDERAAELARRDDERGRIKARLDELVKERADYVRKAESARRAAGEADGFDQEVLKAVKAQAEKAGINY